MDLSDLPVEVEEQFNFSSNSSFYCLDEADCAEADGGSMPSFVLILTAIIYSLIFCAGITGNTLVIYCVLRFPSLHTVTNTYILNLALADECFLLGVPLLVATMLLQDWVFGGWACTLYMVSTAVNQMTSSLFLMVLSADRYLAVCHPITSPRLRTPLVSRLVSISTWLFSLLLMLPVFLFSRTVSGPEGGGTSCHIVWTGLGAENSSLADLVNQHTAFTFYSFSLGFAGPALLILTFYGLVMVQLWCSATVRPSRSPSQQRLQRAVTRLILTVITVYILCWLPHWILQLVLLLSPPARLGDSTLLLILASSCLQYANSAINPVLYAFLSDHFKKSFREACFCFYGRRGAASFHRGDLTFTTRRTRRGPVFTAVVQEDSRTREIISTHVSSVSRSPSTIRNNNLGLNIVSGRLAPPAFK